jgi:hypothetical protein
MIKWSRKVPQKLISQLYNQSATGICDNELADEVGYALYARCESIISVTNGYEKECLICPKCGNEVALSDNIFNCRCGGFYATWEEFRSSYKNKQLYAANALYIFLDYCKNFPKAKTYGEKLICIDILIHSFHIKNSYHRRLNSNDPENETVEINRPAGANLIEGSLSEVILFLDKLSAIDEYSQEKERWRKIIERANGGHVINSQ